MKIKLGRFWIAGGVYKKTGRPKGSTKTRIQLDYSKYQGRGRPRKQDYKVMTK